MLGSRGRHTRRPWSSSLPSLGLVPAAGLVVAWQSRASPPAAQGRRAGEQPCLSGGRRRAAGAFPSSPNLGREGPPTSSSRWRRPSSSRCSHRRRPSSARSPFPLQARKRGGWSGRVGSADSGHPGSTVEIAKEHPSASIGLGSQYATAGYFYAKCFLLEAFPYASADSLSTERIRVYFLPSILTPSVIISN